MRVGFDYCGVIDMEIVAWLLLALAYIFLVCPFIGSSEDNYLNAVGIGLAFTAMILVPVIIIAAVMWAIGVVFK